MKSKAEPKPFKFEIDRSIWKNGSTFKAVKHSDYLNDTYVEDSSLLNNEGHMCCLGFYAEACGVPHKRLDGVAIPSDLIGLPRVPRAALKKMEWLTGSKVELIGSEVEKELYQTNDDPDISKQDRERKIKALFKKYGNVEVTFVGKSPRE